MDTLAIETHRLITGLETALVPVSQAKKGMYQEIFLEHTDTGHFRILGHCGHWMSIYEEVTSLRHRRVMAVQADEAKALVAKLKAVNGSGSVSTVNFVDNTVGGHKLSESSAQVPDYRPLLTSTVKKQPFMGFSPKYLDGVVECFKKAKYKGALKFEFTGIDRETRVTAVDSLDHGSLVVIVMPYRVSQDGYVEPVEKLHDRLTSFIKGGHGGNLKDTKETLTEAALLREILAGALQSVEERAKEAGEALRKELGLE